MNNARINTKFSGVVHWSNSSVYIILLPWDIAPGPSNHKVIGAISALFTALALHKVSYLTLILFRDVSFITHL